MWAWASSSDAARALALALVACVSLGAAPRPRAEKVYLTLDEALKLCFADCAIEKRVVYLTDEQRAAAAKLAGSESDAKIARPYVATKDGKQVGVAYVDVHRVRSLKESVLIVIDPQGRLARVELLSFAEPLEYVPRADWWGQFTGKRLDDELALKRGVRGISGATLSARAAVDAARRVLALHKVLEGAKS